jgi:hypothetical protein
MRFTAFLDKKTNQARKELEILRDVLKEGGVEVKEFLKGGDPYLFVPSTKKSLEFGGVRVYKIGSGVAYRIQNEAETQPFGASYPLGVEKMFYDLIGDMGEEEAAEEIKKAVVEEFKNFFDKSLEAQDEGGSRQFDPQSKIVTGGKIGDLSNAM